MFADTVRITNVCIIIIVIETKGNFQQSEVSNEQKRNICMLIS